MKSIHFYVCGGHLKNVWKTTHFRCRTTLHLKSSLTSHDFSMQKKKQVHVFGNAWSFHRHHHHFHKMFWHGSGSVHCADSIAGQGVSGVLAERLQPGVVAHFQCHTALHPKSSITSYYSVAKNQVHLLEFTCKASSPLSPEVEAAARSGGRTRQPVRRCPESWQSNTWLESLCRHSGYPLTRYRVRATDWTAAEPSCENGDSADESFKRPQARAVDCFAHWNDLWKNFSYAGLYGIANES